MKQLAVDMTRTASCLLLLGCLWAAGCGTPDGSSADDPDAWLAKEMGRPAFARRAGKLVPAEPPAEWRDEELEHWVAEALGTPQPAKLPESAEDLSFDLQAPREKETSSAPALPAVPPPGWKHEDLERWISETTGKGNE